MLSSSTVQNGTEQFAIGLPESSNPGARCVYIVEYLCVEFCFNEYTSFDVRNQNPYPCSGIVVVGFVSLDCVAFASPYLSHGSFGFVSLSLICRRYEYIWV